MLESAAHGRFGVRRQIWLIRSNRLHPGAPATRTIQRGGSVVHGASPGYKFLVAGLPIVGPANAKTVRIGSSVSGDHVIAPGAYSQVYPALPTYRGVLRGPCRLRRSRGAGAGLQQSEHAGAGDSTVVERQLPRDDHQRG